MPESNSRQPEMEQPDMEQPDMGFYACGHRSVPDILDRLSLDVDRQDLFDRLSFCLDSHIGYLENFSKSTDPLRIAFTLPGYVMRSESVHFETMFDREKDVMYVHIEDPLYASVKHVAPYQSSEAHSARSNP